MGDRSALKQDTFRDYRERTCESTDLHIARTNTQGSLSNIWYFQIEKYNTIRHFIDLHIHKHTHTGALYICSILEQWLWLWQCYEDRFLCIHLQTSEDSFYNKMYCLHVLYSYIHMFTILLTSSQEQVFGRSSQLDISVPHLVLFSHLSHIEWRYWRLTARTRWLLAVQGLWLVHN